MAEGSRGGGEEPGFFDRDTEPIPRARFQGERGRHAATDERLDYIDVFTPMLSAQLQPRPELFRSDGLHLDEDGYALIKRVRELGSESGGAVPAIALTANARAEDRSRAG